MVKNSTEIKECLVKPIWDDRNPYRKLRIDENTQYDFDYYENSMESLISEKPTGFYVYKEIEWLDFPLDTSNGKQNIQFIKSMIEDIGQYKLEISDDNLRLYAYFKK